MSVLRTSFQISIPSSIFSWVILSYMTLGGWIVSPSRFEPFIAGDHHCSFEREGYSNCENDLVAF